MALSAVARLHRKLTVTRRERMTGTSLGSSRVTRSKAQGNLSALSGKLNCSLFFLSGRLDRIEVEADMFDDTNDPILNPAK